MNNRDGTYLQFIKPVVDFFIGVIGTVFLFCPVLIVITIFYSFGRDKGPIIFRQERLGKDGKMFYILKFRSMVVNAESVLESDASLYQKYVENSYKLPPDEDPRLTKIGAFIRKNSIDELPQFINIVKGDMSLIGPRPIVGQELSEYNSEQAKELLSVKPGATGWWQVSGRSDVNYPERCELELYYPRHASLKLDILIFFLTIKKVFLREGAH